MLIKYSIKIIVLYTNQINYKILFSISIGIYLFCSSSASVIIHDL